MVASTPPCSSGEWMSPMTLGSTEQLILAREAGLAVATQVSKVTDT